MTSEDFISVIITAHDRRAYIKNAIKSVLEQTLKKECFEIIIVKNYEDDEVDSYIESNGIKNILSSGQYLGEDYRIAIERSTGSIITFLDDDDVYMPERLKYIYQVFTSDKNVVYFHNSPFYIDGNGNRIQYNFRMRDIEFRNSMRKIIVNSGSPITRIMKVKQIGGDFNMSSIAVRREVLSDRLDFLENIVFTPDPFTFIAALATDGDVIIDNTPLTLYRLRHGRIPEQMNVEKKPFPEGWSLRDRNIMIEMATRSRSKKCINYAMYEKNDFYLYSSFKNIYGGQKKISRRTILHIMLNISPKSFFMVMLLYKNILLFSVLLVSPELARKLFPTVER